MQNVISIAALLLVTSTSAFAQVPPAAPTLAQLKSMAETEKTNTLNLIAAETGKANGAFDVCAVHRLKNILAYDQWFLDHFAELANLQTSYLQAAERAQQKLASLDAQPPVTVLAEQGQTKEVQLTFRPIVEYFKKFNFRYKNTPIEKRQALLELQNDPLMNPPLYVAHNQVLAAMRQMTLNINASLKQANEAYELVFVEKPDSVDVQFLVRGINKELIFGLSAIDGNSISGGIRATNEAAVWNHLSTRNIKLDGHSVNGIRRFFEMQQRRPKSDCDQDNRIKYFVESSYTLPFIRKSELVSLSKVSRPKAYPLLFSTEVGGPLTLEAPLKWEFEPQPIEASGILYHVGYHQGRAYFWCDEENWYRAMKITNAMGDKKHLEVVEYEGRPGLKYADQFNNRITLKPDGGYALPGW